MLPIIEFKNVSKWYGHGNTRTEVLSNINLTIEEGEFLAIVGFTGSGKTTLVNLMTGLLQPSEGEVLYRGQPITGPAPERGIIFQNYSLLPWYTVYQNVGLAVDEVYPYWTKEQRNLHIRKFVQMVGLSHAVDKHPAELSGGMRQRVSIARVLATDPDLLLMDEPLGALDALTRGNLQDEILQIWGTNRRSAVLITNDVDEGIYMADRIIPLDPGPAAGLGPEFRIELERPRDKTDMNHDPHFKRVRTDILNYLVQLGEAGRPDRDASLTLPDIQPIKPGSRSFVSKWRRA
ncbi:nitrate/nitrite transport system ATP-binding protein [Neolewinella xylanilytica]|uniref:Nitrate/nitrite transport system ATP-binding protein n=1 Tax=Neolewinella xylanilytica TaxID=1514080 RepID=A0A2S6IA63_9BACT|nr:ABC transporter ATP-binding protein [Neolewinella xylanilytica]PPK88393.1 nitrate/nitrite transport system ATP-binding protein [Neolewinella xylanilytica]